MRHCDGEQTDNNNNFRTNKPTMVTNDINDLETEHISNEMIGFKENFHTNVENDSDSNLYSCGRVSENFDVYIEHIGMGGGDHYCDPCNETVQYEHDLKRHGQKH